MTMAYLKSLSVHVHRGNKNNKETVSQFQRVPTMEYYTVD
jgi:hypothetical protein